MRSEQYKHIEEQMKIAADSYEPTDVQAAWEAMEKKLNKDDNRRLALMAKLRWLDDLFLLLTVFVLFVVPVTNQIKGSSKFTANTQTTANDAGKVQPVLPEAKRAEENATRDQQSSGKSTGFPNVPPTKISATREDAQVQPAIPVVPRKSKSEEPSNANRGNNGLRDTDILPITNVDLSHTQENTNYNKQRLTLWEKPAISTVAGVYPAVKNLSPAINPTRQHIDGNKSIQLTTSNLLQRFSIGVVGAAEWTSAKDGQPDGAGLGGGLLLGYSISKSITLQAGISYSRKLYTGGPNTYNPKPGSYWEQVSINKIEADCEVWEIPVRAAWTFQQKKKSAFYAVGGISAAVMKKEQYHINYTRLNGSMGYGKPTYSTGKFHPAAALLLGAGYRRQLTNHLQAVAEPFFKLPLQGVGEGKIHLRSAGLSIGMQYQF